MIPKTLSASSLLVAEGCMSRWKAENFDRAPREGGSAAMVGTSVHGALELFVKGVHLENKYEWSDKKLLLDLYMISYMDTFQTADIDTAEYLDGLELVKKWYKRTDLKDKVISCETKSTFDIKTSVGEIPFTYIWDRFDQISETEFKVVDYKTIRRPIGPQQLKAKIQPRAYALAAQIQCPEATRIWVEFDMLRHDPVAIVFSREDNIAAYRYLQRAAERIIATDEAQVMETLNPECGYCVRLATCETMKRSIDAGSIHGLDADDLAARKLDITSQLSALTRLDEEIDKILVLEAESRDSFNWKTPNVEVNIGASKRRALNDMAAAEIIGPEIMKQYGKLRLGDVDTLMKGDLLDQNQKDQLKNLIYTNWGEPRAKVTPLNPIDED